MKVINQQTLIPFGLAIVMIGSVATWVEMVRGDIKNHSDQLEILSKNHEAHIKLIIEMNSRLSRIEWALETRKGK